MSAPDVPLFVIDLLLVKQRAGPITVAFDDGDVTDLVDCGIGPEQFLRI